MVIPTTAAIIVAIQTCSIILLGTLEPNELRIAMTFVGINCNDAVFITIIWICFF